MLCHRVTSSLHLIDPLTLKFVEVSAGTYWRYPFQAVMSAAQLTEFVVMNVEKADSATGEGFNKHGALRDKLALAEVQCARASDLGSNDQILDVVSHLGNILKPGDSVMGFDIENSNIGEEYLQALKNRRLPEVILVRKVFEKKQRKWRLKRLKTEKGEDLESKGVSRRDQDRDHQDFEELMEDLEQDPEMRKGVNLYKVTSAAPRMEDDSKENNIDVAELLDDFDHIGVDDHAEIDPEDAAALGGNQSAAPANPFLTA